jgi:hypothetical protein
MLPSLRSDPDDPRETVLPLAVTVGSTGLVGRGAVRVGVRVLTIGRGAERTGVRTAGVGVDAAVVVGVPVAGTSFSAGCAVVS